MPAIARKGDTCTGHGGWPSRACDGASSDVFVNGIEVHRQGDHWVTHCNAEPECHDSTLSSGSSKVFINGKQCGRVGDPVACGSAIASGSSNVFAG